MSSFPVGQKYEVLIVSGDLPRCKSSATMTAVEKRLYLFGGLNCECGWLDDFHVFDTGKPINLVFYLLIVLGQAHWSLNYRLLFPKIVS